MVEFAGWDMPVQYRGIQAEHAAVRSRAGLFDVSHMGQIDVKGPGAAGFCQRVATNDVERLKPSQAQYTLLLNERAGVIDDLVIFRLEADRYLLCVNAARSAVDFAWLAGHAGDDVTVRDVSDTYALLALQGPAAEPILQRFTALELPALKGFTFATGEVSGVHCIVSRTGYTGEDGFELYLSPSEAAKVWDALLDAGKPAGIRPAGLAARNTLRLEVRYLLYGNDIDETTNAWEAGLGWIVDLGQGPFVGREGLFRIRQEGPTRKLVGFEITGRGIARDHDPVLIDGSPSSQVSSGSYSPYGKKSIGLAYLPVEKAVPGQELEIENRRRLLPAVVVKTPFYRRS
jgi:aminomethyltransferase